MEIYETELVFLASEPFFAGHYPGRPVTPGVMLIDRAVKAAGDMLGCKVGLKGIKKVKFSSPVLPGETVSLRLERRGESEMSDLFSRNGTPCASGIFML